MIYVPSMAEHYVLNLWPSIGVNHEFRASDGSHLRDMDEVAKGDDQEGDQAERWMEEADTGDDNSRPQRSPLYDF